MRINLNHIICIFVATAMVGSFAPRRRSNRNNRTAAPKAPSLLPKQQSVSEVGSVAIVPVSTNITAE